MTVILPDPAAATVRGLESDEGSVRVTFALRDAAQRDQLVDLLTYAQEAGFAVELRLLHYKGQPKRR